jgi:hypothetical protein
VPREVIQRYRVLNVEFENATGGPASAPVLDSPADSARK